MIAAVSNNYVLGNAGEIPWHLPKDFAYFKQKTLNKPIIMGRKTFESIGRPLPKRFNIVLTRDTNFKADGVTVCHDSQQAIQLATNYYQSIHGNNPEIMIIGGEQIYRLFLEKADTVYLTEINLKVDGDAHFPALDVEQWQLTESTPEEEKGIQFDFNIYHKRK